MGGGGLYWNYSVLELVYLSNNSRFNILMGFRISKFNKVNQVKVMINLNIVNK